jgi:hypothetical protein
MLVVDQFGLSVHLAAVVVPVAVYFLILGLLNTRRHPQMLSAGTDLALLMLALCPLVLVPLLGTLEVHSLPVILAAVAAVAMTARLIAPATGTWVIYNIPLDQARRSVGRALDRMGLSAEVARDGTLRLPGGGTVRMDAFPLLRNVTVRLEDAPGQASPLADALQAELGTLEADSPPSAVALLMVATAMLIAPLALATPQAGEIVRLLSDLLG